MVPNPREPPAEMRGGVDTGAHFPLPARVVKLPLLALLSLAIVGCASAPPQPRQVEHLTPLPIALNPDFTFRKTIQYFLDPAATPVRAAVDASVSFERYYRLYGALNSLDTRQRFGNYYTIFWRSRHPADVTVRLEYRQEKLHAFTQAREVTYHQVHGTTRTVFAIIGDDFLNDGRVIAWRASLVVDGQIVALSRSYLWE